MTAIEMNNNGKRLMAAFIAFAMIVCAIAVVAIPSDAGAAGQDGKPTYDFTGDSVVAVDSVEDLTEEIGFTDGVLTVTEDLVLNVTGTIGSTTAPAIKQIVLNGGDLQITGNGTIYIKNTGDGVSTIVFGADDSVLNITGGVTVNLDADGANSFVINNGDINVNGCTSFNTALLSVTDEAVLNITHTSGKSTWYNADGGEGETYLDVDNATVNFNESHSVQGVVLDADNAKINLNDADTTAIVLKNGSTITASTLTVDSPTNAGIYMKGTVTIEQGSKVSVSGVAEGKTGINVENVDGQKSELKIDATSSVDAESVGFAKSSDELIISGAGTFIGDLTTGSATTASYTVQGPITLGNSESPVTATDVSLSTLADNEGNTPTMYLDKESAMNVKYTDGDIVVVKETKYTMFNKVFTLNFTPYYFTLGVCLGTPTYTGQSFSLSDLSPNADVFGVYTNSEHTEKAPDVVLSAAIDPSQTEANETLDNIINVGEYPLKVTVTITSGSAGQYYSVNADFEIVAADYKVTLDCGDGWNEDAYTDADAPVVTITDVNNKLVDLDYALTFVDSTGKRYTEAQIADLKADTYDVIVTAIATDDNYNDVNKTFEDALTVGAFETLDSDVQFFPIESEEILGFDPALIQDGIEFSVPVKTSDGYDVTLTGKVIAIAADDTELLDALKDAGFTSPAAGYYLAFYVDVPEGKHVDTENMTIVIGTDKTNYVQLANPDEESNDVYPYFIYYIGTKLPASTTAVGEDEDDILNVTVDLDGGSAEYYKATAYNIDLTQLNLYRIVLVDEYNDTLEYLYPEGYEFYLPSGAGQGFNYWTTEDNSPYKSFQTNSIMVVSDKYANGDYEIVLTANYEDHVITPDDPAQSVIIGIYKDVDNGRFVITFVGEDGSVPAGAVNVTINYLVYDDFAQAYVQSSTPITITGEEISAGQSIFQITTELGDIDMGLINSIEVSYTAGDVNASNDAIYAVTLPATA